MIAQIDGSVLAEAVRTSAWAYPVLEAVHLCSLAALFGALGGRVRLLQGGVERIQGHALGQLLLAVTGSPLDAEALRQRASQWAQQVEVLGYVV